LHQQQVTDDNCQYQLRQQGTDDNCQHKSFAAETVEMETTSYGVVSFCVSGGNDQNNTNNNPEKAYRGIYSSSDEALQ
jgi:hypothetical protein